MWEKSGARTAMDNIVQECRNSFQAIKMSSLSEESKTKIVKLLIQERKKKFNKFDYQLILQEVLEESKIPAKDLYDIVIELMEDERDINMSDLLEWGDVFVEYVNDKIPEKYTKEMPKTIQDLKKALVPFEVTDENFAMFLLWGEDIEYRWQKLHLWPLYNKLLEEKKEIEKKIRDEFKKEIEKDNQLKKLDEEINGLQMAIHGCRINNPGPHWDGYCEAREKEIQEIIRKMKTRRYTILHGIKEKYWYDDIISKIKTYEELTFREKYNYLNNIYDRNIRNRNLDNISDKNI